MNRSLRGRPFVPSPHGIFGTGLTSTAAAGPVAEDGWSREAAFRKPFRAPESCSNYALDLHIMNSHSAVPSFPSAQLGSPVRCLEHVTVMAILILKDGCLDLFPYGTRRSLREKRKSLLRTCSFEGLDDPYGSLPARGI